jgi:hypothetical protein
MNPIYNCSTRATPLSQHQAGHLEPNQHRRGTHHHRTTDPTRRVHRHLQPSPSIPPAPKPSPAHAIDTHNRVRTDRVDQFGKLTLRHGGRLHHIGIGRTHARTRVLLLVQDLNIRIINATTGELIRQLTLDPTRDYQPRHTPTGRPKKKPEP